MVRATFKMWSCARAEEPQRVIAFSSNFSPSAEIPHAFEASLGASGRSNRSFLSAIPFDLAVPRSNDTDPHRVRILRQNGCPQFLILDRGNFNVNVNAIEQRAGNLGYVSLDHRRCAVALAPWIAKISAGAGFIAAAEHEPSRKVTETAAREIVTAPSLPEADAFTSSTFL